MVKKKFFFEGERGQVHIFIPRRRFSLRCHNPVSDRFPKGAAQKEVPLRLEDAQVQPERRGELEEIIERLYRRRTLRRLSTWDQLRYGPELADFLRRRSRVYRRLGGAPGEEGPLPFALGFFRIAAGGRLDPVADAVPDPQPELIVQLLSEFLEPGARLFFGRGESEQGWRIEGEGEISRLKEQ